MGSATHSNKFLILQQIAAAAIVHIHRLQEVIRLQVLPDHPAAAAALHQEVAAAVVEQVVQAEVATKSLT